MENGKAIKRNKPSKEFYSCMQRDDFAKAKCSQVSVAVHESFLNSFGHNCDDDEFASYNQGVAVMEPLNIGKRNS